MAPVILIGFELMTFAMLRGGAEPKPVLAALLGAVVAVVACKVAPLLTGWRA